MQIHCIGAQRHRCRTTVAAEVCFTAKHDTFHSSLNMLMLICYTSNCFFIFKYKYRIYLKCVWFSILLNQATGAAEAGRSGFCTRNPRRPGPQRLSWLLPIPPTLSPLLIPAHILTTLFHSEHHKGSQKETLYPLLEFLLEALCTHVAMVGRGPQSVLSHSSI